MIADQSHLRIGVLGTPRRFRLVGIVVPLTLLAAGCGSSHTSSTTAWANDLCSSVTAWKSSISAAANSVTGGSLSTSTLRNASQEVRSATNTFVDDLNHLGRPNTQAGAKAQKAVSELSDEISTGAQEVKSAVQGATSVSGALNAISTVSGTLAKMSDEVSSTYHELEQVNVTGELSNAFKDASACKDLNRTIR